MSSTEEIIGRADVNDLEAILAITNTDVDEADPRGGGQRRRHLHVGLREGRRARRSTSSTRRPRTRSGTARPTSDWSTDVDHEAIAVLANGAEPNWECHRSVDPTGTPLEQLGRQGVDRARRRVAELDAQPVHARRAGRAALHGQDRRDGAVDRRQVLRLDPGDGRGPPRRGVRQVPRHQADRPLPDQRPPRMLLDDIINDSRWDMTYLGMQIMVEGLALAAFGFMHQLTAEPLLKQLLRYVMSDEARHVAFGVLSLKEYYAELDRRRDARAPGVRLRGRGAHARPVPAAGGVGAHGRRPARRPSALRDADRPSSQMFQQMLFSKIVPELQEARPARRQRRLAARALRGDRRDPVRGLGRHRRGVRRVLDRPRSPRTAPPPPDPVRFRYPSTNESPSGATRSRSAPP